MNSLDGRILVTGGAGFIGSALVWALNQRGHSNIVITDFLGSDEKWKNLVALKFADYVEAGEFRRQAARTRQQIALVAVEQFAAHGYATTSVAAVARAAGVSAQTGVLAMRMVPVREMFDRFPRVVRDTARRSEKLVDFRVEGHGIELDRTILDEIADPLVHLLRNAVGHGIESPAEITQLA